MQNEFIKKLIEKHFKNDYDEPFELTDGQCEIVKAIYFKENSRVQVITPTQYGKSDTISMSIILRVFTFKEDFAIISGSKDKAQIIMSRVIQHIFDDPLFINELELDKDTSLDRLKRERSKDHITFKSGGSIRTFTANTRNKSATKEALTGFGSQNIIEDESALIPDDAQAMVLRMLGGQRNSFLLKIGNPFYRNHFYRTSLSDRYHQIFIDYHQALKEARFTQEFIEEMKNEAFFNILYECKFPDEDEFYLDGYRKLFNKDLLENAYVDEKTANELLEHSDLKLGADFAGGGNDRTAFVIRNNEVMMIEQTNKNKDTMSQIPILQDIQKKHKIEDEDVSLDYGGLGQGIGDRLYELDNQPNLIMFGSSAPDIIENDGISAKEKYKNMRAYMYYELYKWLKNGGKILKDDRWQELLYIYYKISSEKKIQIQPKAELKKILKNNYINVSSPDIADAGVLTFASSNSYIDDDDFTII